MKTNELIELPELDKLEITNKALRASLSIYDCIDGSVTPEIKDKLLEVFKTSFRRELSKERFKILKQELIIKEQQEQIEQLKKQIR